MNSVSPGEKKRLLGIYLKTRLWNYAIRLYEDANGKEADNLSAFKLLSELLPTHSKALLEAKNKFTALYNENR